MGIINGNSDLVRFVLMTLGIKDLKITASDPGTKFIISFTKYGEDHKVELTALEIIESIVNKDNHNPAPGFKDITEITIQDGSQQQPDEQKPSKGKKPAQS